VTPSFRRVSAEKNSLNKDARLRSPPAQRSSRRRCDLRCAAIHQRVNRRWRPCVHCRCCRSDRESVPTRAKVMHVYEVGPRKDHRGVDLISDALPFRLPMVLTDGTITSVALGHCVRHSPETGGPSDHNCSRASLHSDVVSLYNLQRSAISD